MHQPISLTELMNGTVSIMINTEGLSRVLRALSIEYQRVRWEKLPVKLSRELSQTFILGSATEKWPGQVFILVSHVACQPSSCQNITAGLK